MIECSRDQSFNIRNLAINSNCTLPSALFKTLQKRRKSYNSALSDNKSNDIYIHLFLYFDSENGNPLSLSTFHKINKNYRSFKRIRDIHHRKEVI